MNRKSHLLSLSTLAVAAGIMAVPFCSAAADAAPAAPAAPPPPPPPPKWETTAALGFTLTQGNSDTLLLTANIITLRKWEKNEFGMGAGFAYGENDGERNAQSATGFIQYNRLFSERFFAYGRADVLHDAIADITYRVALSPGAGYYFVKNDKMTLSAEAGPGWIIEEQGGDQRNYFTLRVAERFTYKLSDRARIWQKAEYLPEVENFDNFIINAEIGVESDLTKKMSLRVYLQDTYDNEPAPGRKENDMKVVAAIAYKF